MTASSQETVLFVVVAFMFSYKAIDLLAMNYKIEQSLFRARRHFGASDPGQRSVLVAIARKLKKRGRECASQLALVELLQRSYGVVVGAALLVVFSILGYSEILLPADHEGYWNTLVVALATAFMSAVASLLGLVVERFRLILESL